MSDKVRVIIIDDEVNFAEVLGNEIARMGFQSTVVHDGDTALERISSEPFDVALLDIRLPGMSGIEILDKVRKLGDPPEVIMLTGHATIDTALEAMKLGAYDYLTKPCKLEELGLIIQKAAEKGEVIADRKALRSFLGQVPPDIQIVGESEAMESLLGSLDKIAAATDVPVLVTGESGTGKELIARELHRRSPLSEQAFVAINCAVLQPSVLESELFGHEKGSFTGAAARKVGLFELAKNGTLFLDEIGEVDEAIQAKLLRAIQFGEYRRLGGTESLTAKVRVIAATNRNLEADIVDGKFREDLYYRLNVVQLQIPPLRERPQDILPLAEYFLGKYGSRHSDVHFDKGARKALTNHLWPGNVRELENFVRRLLIFHEGGAIKAESVEECFASPHAGRDKSPPTLALEDIERDHILTVLKLTGGNKTEAAAKLGIALKTLYNKINAYREQGCDV